MNRMRIVSLAAASLGVAVVAGTLLQGLAEPPAAPAPSSAAPAAPAAETSLANLAEPAPQFTGASILPGALEVGAAGLDAVLETPSRDAMASAPGVTLWLAPPELAMAAAASASDLVQAPLSDPLPGDDAAEALIDEPDPCTVWLSVLPQPGATIEVSLFAPCDGGAAVGLAHGGLRFDGRLDADGQFLVTMPALAVLASVEVSLPDGRSVTDSAVVADVALHDRVAIQWQGPFVLGLNAYEFGAAHGETGHIGPDRRGVPGAVDGGTLSVLGDPTLDLPRLAQVYSFPEGLARESGEVELELEVAITEASCGRSLEIEMLELRAGSGSASRTIRLDMPGCDGAGGYLLLRNLLPEPDIALGSSR